MQEWFISWEYTNNGSVVHGWNVFNAGSDLSASHLVNKYIRELAQETGLSEDSIIIKAFNKV